MNSETTPLVSVMIVAYNQEDIIRETIESILQEPRYPNLEIVVSDDCSVDGTVEVVRNLQTEYPNIIKLVENSQNQGITRNSNSAFFATSGEYVCVMGGDDLFLRGKISTQVREFLDDPSLALSYHPVEVLDDQTGQILAVTDQKKHLEKKSVYDVISKAGIAGASSMMVRRSACPEYGFDERLPVVSDWKFAIDVAFNGKVKLLPKVLGQYRKTGTGASERTYVLLDESLKTLDLTKAEHPGDKLLSDAISKGGARYIAGELFRSMSSHPERIPELTKKLLSYRRSVFYVCVCCAALVSSRTRAFHKVAMWFGHSLRSMTK